jgi:hypothetical protein
LAALLDILLAAGYFCATGCFLCRWLMLAMLLVVVLVVVYVLVELLDDLVICSIKGNYILFTCLQLLLFFCKFN